MPTPAPAPVLSPALAHFLYISKATAPFDEEALEGLLVSARRFNEAHEITGLLLYDEVHVLRLAQFCQYVEGPSEAVEEVRGRIEGDRRHTGVTYLHEGRRAERLFPTWTMAYERVSTVESATAVRRCLESEHAARGGSRSVPMTLLGTFIGLSNGGRALARAQGRQGRVRVEQGEDCSLA